MSTLKKKIMAINATDSLSKEEKNKAIQKLMSSNVVAAPPLPCSHYNKQCSHFFFDCCQTHDSCVRCHRERCTECQTPHVSTIVCDVCECVQRPSRQCSDCGVVFQKNYCGICFLWTDKDITHCIECGLCRVGKPNELFHCPVCGVCFSKTAHHVCVAKKETREMQCSMCLEKTFDAQQGYSITQCGHSIHVACMENAVRNHIYKCGICRKSMLDMTFHWIMMRQEIGFQDMPLEYMRFTVGDTAKTQYGLLKITRVEEDRVSGKLDLTPNTTATFLKRDLKQMIDVYCNDCDQRTLTAIHFIGNMCTSCGGFNTSRL